MKLKTYIGHRFYFIGFIHDKIIYNSYSKWNRELTLKNYINSLLIFEK